MEKDADKSISNLEKAFILQALKQDQRLDGRRPYDFRTPSIEFATDDSGATVRLGNTRVMCVVTAKMEPPYAGRAHEGMIRFNVEFSPMASPAFEPGRPPESAVMLARLVERSLKQSNAVDAEALCVLAGRKVWSLRVDLHVLDHCGNLGDACCLAALAGLLAFRKPDVTIENKGNKATVKVHSPQEREPIPLTIHHWPVPVTIALFEEGTLVAVDPNLQEEACMHGSCTFVMNQYKELCVVQKAQGIGLSPMQLLRCMRIATNCVEDVIERLTVASEVHKQARVQARIRRKTPFGAIKESRTVSSMAARSTTSVTNRDDVKAILQELELQAEEAKAMEEGSSSEDEDEEAGMETDQPHQTPDQQPVKGEPSTGPMEVEPGGETPAASKASHKLGKDGGIRLKQDGDDARGVNRGGGVEKDSEEGQGGEESRKASSSGRAAADVSQPGPKKKAKVGKLATKIKLEDESGEGGGFDMLEAIAATIAGAGMSVASDEEDDEGRGRDLRVAIKKKSAKPKTKL